MNFWDLDAVLPSCTCGMRAALQDANVSLNSSPAESSVAQVLRAWVEETWNRQEFLRLCVVEALLVGKWRNRDVWKHFQLRDETAFQLRDETAVAGIKFRALKRMRELAAREGVVPSELELRSVGLQSTWRNQRVSCPAPRWIARLVVGTLQSNVRGFLCFHLDDMECASCRAGRDDLLHGGSEAELLLLSERLHASALHYRLGSDIDPIG